MVARGTDADRPAVTASNANDERRRDRERRYRQSVVLALVLSAAAHAAFFMTGGLEGVPLVGDGERTAEQRPDRPWTEEPVQLVQIRERTPESQPVSEAEVSESSSAASASANASSSSSSSAAASRISSSAATTASAATVVANIRPVSELRSALASRDEEERRVRIEDFVPKSVRASGKEGPGGPAFREASQAVGLGGGGFGGAGGHCSTPPATINSPIGTTVFVGG